MLETLPATGLIAVPELAANTTTETPAGTEPAAHTSTEIPAGMEPTPDTSTKTPESTGLITDPDFAAAVYPETLTDDIEDDLRQLFQGTACATENVPALSETEAAASPETIALIRTAFRKTKKVASRKRATGTKRATNCQQSSTGLPTNNNVEEVDVANPSQRGS